MKEFIISHLEEGQRFDKYLVKRLPNASKSFLYKMLRKKNITLNHKKADGSEKIRQGDVIQMFFADETYEKFASVSKTADNKNNGMFKKFNVPVLYEDEDIIAFNKPAGMLSQRAESSDYSLVEYTADYLLNSGAVTEEALKTFHPGVCNRLDRNTSGIVVAGKTVKGLQEMTAAFKERTLYKYYLCIVKGQITERSHVSGYLLKDEKNNKVQIFSKEEAAVSEEVLPIETEYIPVCSNKAYTLLKVHLITGRSHQIRAHLAYLSHPLLGDRKYGDTAVNKIIQQKYKINNQLLHAYELQLPGRGLKITTPVPDSFISVLEGEHLWQRGIQEDLEALH
jgi:23S rRNA pseudouridine955/2504/2580 synthase